MVGRELQSIKEAIHNMTQAQRAQDESLMIAIEKLTASVDALRDKSVPAAFTAPINPEISQTPVATSIPAPVATPGLNHQLSEDSAASVVDPFYLFNDNPQEAASREHRRQEMAASNPYQVSPARAVSNASPLPPRTPSVFDIAPATPTPAQRNEPVSVLVPTPSSASRMTPARARKRTHVDGGSDESPERESLMRRRSKRLTRDQDHRE
jgi:hypothetical protein